MPYYFDEHVAPKPGRMGLEEIQCIWEIIKNDLLGVKFETKNQAMSKESRGQNDEFENRYFDWSLIRYRKTDDRDMIVYFHELGLEALAYTEQALEHNRIDANFLYYWGMLSACHGYVMCAALANGNDLASDRAGAASKSKTSLQLQKVWYSHYLLREWPNCKNRTEAEERLLRLVLAVVNGDFPELTDKQREWCERIISTDKTVFIDGKEQPNPRYRMLTKSFLELSRKDMNKLLSHSTTGLPPLDLEIPPP